MRRFGRWKVFAAAVLAAAGLSVLATGPAFASESGWQNIEGWSQSISSSDSASAIEWFGNQMSVWRGEGSGATNIYYSLNGSLPRQIPNGQSANAPTVVLWNGFPTVLIRTTDNVIWYTYMFNNTFQAWHPVPNFDTTLSTPTAATVRNGQVLQVAYRGTNNRMYMFGMQMFNSDPSDADETGQGEIAGGGTTLHSPAIARILSVGGDDGLLIVHTGTDGHVYRQHAYVDVAGNPSAPGYLGALYEGVWTEIRDRDGGQWVTNSRPTIATNAQDLGIIRVGMMDLDHNMAYIAGDNEGFMHSSFDNWQIEHNRAALLAPPTLYDNTDTGEIDAIAFINNGLFHLMRVMRCN